MIYFIHCSYVALIPSLIWFSLTLIQSVNVIGLSKIQRVCATVFAYNWIISRNSPKTMLSLVLSLCCSSCLHGCTQKVGGTGTQMVELPVQQVISQLKWQVLNCCVSFVFRAFLWLNPTCCPARMPAWSASKWQGTALGVSGRGWWMDILHPFVPHSKIMTVGVNPPLCA